MKQLSSTIVLQGLEEIAFISLIHTNTKEPEEDIESIFHWKYALIISDSDVKIASCVSSSSPIRYLEII